MLLNHDGRKQANKAYFASRHINDMVLLLIGFDMSQNFEHHMYLVIETGT